MTTHLLFADCSSPCCGILRPFCEARLCSVASIEPLHPPRIKDSYVEYVEARFYEPCKDSQNLPVEPNPPIPRSVSPSSSSSTSLKVD